MVQRVDWQQKQRLQECGIPKNIKIGVNKKPPPTPTKPIISPKKVPTPKITNE